MNRLTGRARRELCALRSPPKDVKAPQRGPAQGGSVEEDPRLKTNRGGHHKKPGRRRERKSPSWLKTHASGLEYGKKVLPGKRISCVIVHASLAHKTEL